MKITCATSIKYGNYKHLQVLVRLYTNMIHTHRAALMAAFDFRPDVEIHFRPIKASPRRGLKTSGRASDEQNRVELDPRQMQTSLRSCLETLAHELTHCEQYKQGRLLWSKAHTNLRIWNGEPYRHAHMTTQHKQYLALPWEVEARERAAAFVLAQLGPQRTAI